MPLDFRSHVQHRIVFEEAKTLRDVPLDLEPVADGAERRSIVVVSTVVGVAVQINTDVCLVITLSAQGWLKIPGEDKFDKVNYVEHRTNIIELSQFEPTQAARDCAAQADDWFRPEVSIDLARQAVIKMLASKQLSSDKDTVKP